jgi:hypothetical protein
MPGGELGVATKLLPPPDAPAMIAPAEKIFEFRMVERDPLPRWSFWPVTLPGDAAHPMDPNRIEWRRAQR